MSDSTDLHAAAQALLLACIDALDQETDEGSPERRFVSPGVPPWDCPEQLTVHVGGPYIAETNAGRGGPLTPGHRIADAGVLTLVQMTVTILRCLPTVTSEGDVIEFPAPADLDAAAAVVNRDLWAIWNFLVDRKRTGELFGGDCREFSLDPASSIGSQGGAGGWQIPVRVHLGGYRPEPSAPPSE